MIKLYVTNLGRYNEGDLIGEWITLPIEQIELENMLKRIGINEQYEEYFITDYECDFMKINEYQSIEGLNEIAELLENVEDKNKLKAIISWENYFDINYCIENIDNYILYENIKNEEDLGTYWLFESGCYEIPSYLSFYIDCEKWGKDYSINADGYFSDYGWLERC